MKEIGSDIEDVLAAIANPQIAVATRLAMATSRFIKSRQTISRHTLTMLKIASLVRSELKLPIEDFLRDNGIAEDQLSTFARYNDELSNHANLLAKALLTPGLVEKLQSATVDGRQRALDWLASGQIISEADVASITEAQSFNEQERALHVRNASMQSAAEKIGQRAISDVTGRAELLHGKLVSVIEAGALDELARAGIINDARELLARFEALFGKDFVDRADWMVVGIDAPDEMYLSQANYALKELSEGRFNATLLKMGTPYHRWSALDGIGFLAGKPSGHNVRPERLTPSHLQRLTAIEVCARTGLGALGLEAANYDVVAINDVDRELSEFLRESRKDWRVLDSDLRTPQFLAEVSKICEIHGPISLISGTLPRAPFKARHSDGIRKKELLTHTKSLVEALRPRAFLFETHIGVKNTPFVDVWDKLQKDYSKLGYVAKLYTVKAADFGVRQERTFTFIVGIEAECAGNFQLPKPFKGPFDDLKTFVGELPFPHRPLPTSTKKSTANQTADQANYVKWIRAWSESYGESTGLLPSLSSSQENAAFQAWLDHGINHKIVSKPRKSKEITVSSKVPLDFELACRIQGIPLDWPMPGRYRSEGDTISSRAYVNECRLLIEQTPPQVIYGMAQAIRSALTGEPVEDIDFQDVVIKGARYKQPNVISVRGAPPLTDMWRTTGLKDPEMRKALYWQFMMRTFRSAAWQEDIADIEIPEEFLNPGNNRVRFRTTSGG